MAALIHVLLTLFGLLLSCDASRTTVKTYITVGNEKQIMTSPNYPKPYGNVLTYEWYLTANASIPYGVVNFKVIDCRIRDATPCYEEAIIIYNGKGIYSWETTTVVTPYAMYCTCGVFVA
ncbi:hypothetical protein KP79_PYT13255 [Mizuhopecten yessoensis]|uniref:Uncharacterized protein n=1 Tax=Mizuhopecten yessoensis TaxID=6573 RepID=A0A210Q8S5_MIZYE|nr:hypothetical protein KP79_PYT13255 [Mizuhopecten yessoensis]